MGVATTSVTTSALWRPASQMTDALGVNMVIFGHPGVGKTTLLSSAQDTDAGRDVLIFDLEGGTRSIADRDDVMVWRPKTGNKNERWDELMGVVEGLRTKPHPFKTIAIDSLTTAQAWSLDKVMRASATPDMPSQPEYGKANTLVSALLRLLKDMSVEKGLNVLATAHAEDVMNEAGAVTGVRMSITPGLIKSVHQIIDAIGYLSMDPTGKTDNRKLLLKSTTRVAGAKYRQPLSGPQLPLEIPNPSLARIIEHAKGIATFPTRE